MERALALSNAVDALSREVEASLREPTLQDVLDQMAKTTRCVAPAQTTHWEVVVVAALAFFTALVELLLAWVRGEKGDAFSGARSETR